MAIGATTMFTSCDPELMVSFKVGVVVNSKLTGMPVFFRKASAHLATPVFGAPALKILIPLSDISMFFVDVYDVCRLMLLA